MERTPKSNEIRIAEPKHAAPTEERTERPLRLRLDLLEARVAPNAIWGE